MKKNIFIITILTIITLSLQSRVWILDEANNGAMSNDWTAPTWRHSHSVNVEGNLYTDFQSPFFREGPGGTHFIAEGENSDFRPEEGWVLLAAELGNSNFPTRQPWVLLYNTQRGLIRHIFKNISRYNNVTATITRADMISNSNTGILRHINTNRGYFIAHDQRNEFAGSNIKTKIINPFATMNGFLQTFMSVMTET